MHHSRLWNLRGDWFEVVYGEGGEMQITAVEMKEILDNYDTKISNLEPINDVTLPVTRNTIFISMTGKGKNADGVKVLKGQDGEFLLLP
jgi:hypothetical protein